jgi:hypothetical protein
MEMRQGATLNNAFWWGVINYIRVSATSAETPVPSIQYAPDEQIFVFKTSVDGPENLTVITNMLNEHVGEGKWTIDLEDEDKVLRVTGTEYLDKEIIKVFRQAGLECELMPY